MDSLLLESEKGLMLQDIKKKESEIATLEQKFDEIFVKITKRGAKLLGGIGAAVSVSVAVLTLLYEVLKK